MPRRLSRVRPRTGWPHWSVASGAAGSAPGAGSSSGLQGQISARAKFWQVGGHGLGAYEIVDPAVPGQLRVRLDVQPGPEHERTQVGPWVGQDEVGVIGEDRRP